MTGRGWGGGGGGGAVGDVRGAGVVLCHYKLTCVEELHDQ